MNHVIELELTDAANSGEALGRYNGKVVFVPFGAPGDRVRVRIIEDHKRFARGEIVEILSPSTHRVSAPCQHFGVCGGCQWQHVEYPKQLELKTSILAEQLERLGHISDPPVKPIIGMSAPWGYRNHAQFSVSEERRLGYMAAHSHRVVPITKCHIIDPALQSLYEIVDLDWPELERLSLRAGVNTDEFVVILESKNDEPPELDMEVPVSCVLLRSDGSFFPLVGESFIHETILGRTFRISAPSFFQVNTPGTEVLIELVERYLEPAGYETLLDLFCGVGTFGLSLAHRVAKVIGIEAAPSAIEDARFNAEGIDNVELIEGRVEESLTGIDERVHLVVLDPPREGCPPGVVETLMAMWPERIVYVSCDTATLARDAAHLVKGGYMLHVVQPVDMFPQTKHIECVALLDRARSHT